MTKHSKNNTASSIFSYAEYKKLDYGTKRKKDVKRQKEKLEALKKQAEEERERAKEAARERVLLEFEQGQLGLAARPTAGIGTKASAESTASDEPRGTKRKFEFDATQAETLAREAEEAALRQIEKEQAESLKHKLPDFWLPSLTPTYTSKGAPQALSDIKLQTTCRGGNPAHALSLKNLTPVNFTFYTGNGTAAQASSSSSSPDETAKAKEDAEPMCPSCKKRLSNNILLFLSKPCGHVTCKTCTDTLVKPTSQCIVCDKQLKDKDILELQREGTGFAGGGLAETSRAGIAFQG